MRRFENKVAMVTGAGSGIGRATALRLASEGARLAISDINPAGLEETLALLPGAAGVHLAAPLDVSDAGACRAAIADTVAHFGCLHVLCNIAGFAKPQRLAEVSDDDWQRMISVNLSSVFFMCQAAMPHLVATRGAIVNMASSAGLVGQIYNSVYCASKGGVVLLSKALAVEFASSGVRVNAVCPGGVKTPLSAGFKLPENADMNVAGRLWPLMEAAEPEEIAAAVAYLACDEARFVTGEAFAIDGGQTAS
jgi:meso-butanediol dehydrogenase/(S,S)-butanediol dehydrogenase/diacetyl reductase